MFLVRDNFESRKKRILSFITDNDAPIAVFLAAANFEWTVGRAIMALGNSPNSILRPKLQGCSGLARYKDLWKDEVTPKRHVAPLPEEIRNWASFKDAFDLRHLLIHGRESCSKGYAEPRVKRMLDAASDVFAVCNREGVCLNDKLKVRLKPRIR